MNLEKLQKDLHKASQTMFEMEKKTKNELIEEIEYLLHLTNTQHSVMSLMSNTKQRISMYDMVINSILGTVLAILILELLKY